ncbi:MAG: hypothetical protein RL571_3469 [Pseudomonadota bacterium]
MSINIQQTTDADWLDLKTIRPHSLLESPHAFALSYEAASAFTDAQWQARAGNRTLPMYFIARDEGNPIGLIGGVKAGNDFNLIAMWVAPSHRGLGVGRSLVAQVLAVAASCGESEVSLLVSPLNKAACALYERMGFCFTPHFDALESFPEIRLQHMLAKLEMNGASF